MAIYQERLARIDRSIEEARSAIPDDATGGIELAQTLAALAAAEAGRAVYDVVSDILVQIESGRLDPPSI